MGFIIERQSIIIIIINTILLEAYKNNFHTEKQLLHHNNCHPFGVSCALV